MEALRVYGNLSLLEMAPVLLAAAEIYPGRTVLEHGSVMSLWGESSDLASLGSAGNSHLATNSETQALRASARHPDMRFIFTLAECPYRIVARRSAGIATLADLRGKRIGTQRESSAEFFLERMLGTVGLAIGDVHLVHFMAHTTNPISRLPEALQAGEIDAVALWEPQVQRAKHLIAADAVELYDPALYTEKFSVCTKRGHLEDPAIRSEIVAFVRALQTATQRLKSDPERAQKLVAQTAGLDIEVVRNAWHCFDYPGKLAPDLLGVFQRQEPWLARVQHRTARSRDELATLIDDSIVREAAA
ncbi:MAG TPA: ABC transporter substrate-binding protein [Burkholderiales bacterium]|nr:ABC transporter substrate-binding protein [Burkholderiales bacterium]